MSTNDHPEPNPIETRGLLAGAAAAFVAGLGGAIWHTKRKQAKEAALPPITNVSNSNPLPSTMDQPSQQLASQLQSRQPPSAAATAAAAAAQQPQQVIPPNMTPEEYAIAKRQARFFAFKALGYGTLLALGGAGVLSVAVGWWLDVRNFKEFSDKLRETVPVHTRRLRRMLGGSELKMRPEEEEELNRVMEAEE